MGRTKSSSVRARRRTFLHPLTRYFRQSLTATRRTEYISTMQLDGPEG